MAETDKNLITACLALIVVLLVMALGPADQCVRPTPDAGGAMITRRMRR